MTEFEKLAEQRYWGKQEYYTYKKPNGEWFSQPVKGLMWHWYHEDLARYEHEQRHKISPLTRIKSKEVILEIKKRLSILQAAKHYNKEIIFRGTYCMINCPDPGHEDNNPSCALWPEKNIFKCFSCGAKGDVIEFLRLMELTNEQART